MEIYDDGRHDRDVQVPSFSRLDGLGVEVLKERIVEALRLLRLGNRTYWGGGRNSIEKAIQLLEGL